MLELTVMGIGVPRARNDETVGARLRGLLRRSVRELIERTVP